MGGASELIPGLGVCLLGRLKVGVVINRESGKWNWFQWEDGQIDHRLMWWELQVELFVEDVLKSWVYI